jgi:hypothetical protein
MSIFDEQLQAPDSQEWLSYKLRSFDFSTLGRRDWSTFSQ